MTEEWRSVVGFEGLYEVSDLGNVRSLSQLRWNGYGYYMTQPQFLRPGIASHGYPTVTLGRGNTRTVHSLVYDAFHGKLPIGCEIRHRDGNRKNPKKTNLTCGTRLQNIEDAFRHGTRIRSLKPRGKSMPAPEYERRPST
jgi:hypothetical protein